jgi:replicative DNA helicase
VPSELSLILSENTTPKNEAIFQEMLTRVEAVDQYCINRGNMGGLDWGMNSLNKVFEGLNTGIHLIAGQPNIGKSTLCLQLAWAIARANTALDDKHRHKAYVIYFSLDDNDTDLMPRIVAMQENMPINVVKSPEKYKHETGMMIKRTAGMRKIKDSIKHFKMLDGKDGTSLEFIQEQITKHITALKAIDPTYKVVAFIDNFHDIEVTNMNFSNDDNAKYSYISEELDKICTLYDMPIICTAEFRKLNSHRRPTIDDIRSAGKIAYKAKAIMLCYNAVGVRGESADVYFQREDDPDLRGLKQPVLEVKIGKNKFESYKGRLFFEFFPERAFVKEATHESAERYNAMVIG